MELRGAIFDLDGTLIDSMDVWEKVDVEFFKRRNRQVPEGYMEQISSMTFAETARFTIQNYFPQEQAEEIMREWSDLALCQYRDRVMLKPNAKEYLIYLKKRKIRLGIATALSSKLYEPVLRHNGVYSLFDAISSTDEVERGKEFPDIYLLTAEKLRVPPACCIVFEDIIQGIQGAKAGGMMTCGVYETYSDSSWDKVKQEADYTIYDFKEMMTEQKG